jgi:hypothetical protein
MCGVRGTILPQQISGWGDYRIGLFSGHSHQFAGQGVNRDFAN